jgi:DNA ligase-associated metallophosphoesterase
MIMLSGAVRRPPLPRVSASAADPVFATCAEGVGFAVAGCAVVATPEGGLWVESARTLIVSDLHLEKGSSFARRGQMLPPYDTRATLARLEALALRLEPTCIVSLGDSFHDRWANERLVEDDIETLRRLTAKADFIWIEGNHDPKPPEGLGGRAAKECAVAGLALRHEPTPGPSPGEIAGHLHPAAAVSGKGRRVRARCYATDGTRLVMPAFGAFTGGLNVRNAAFADVFAGGCSAVLMARGKVFPAPAHRLLPDG